MTSRFPPGSVANNTVDVYQCADRVSPGDEPRDITSTKHLYVPLDTSNWSVHLRKNPFGPLSTKLPFSRETFIKPLMERG